MKITESYKGVSGVDYILEYSDADSFDGLDYELCRQIRAVCLCDGKMVIGYGGKIRSSWGLIGGTIEKGETFEQTLKREIQEESNMEVLKFVPIGYQKVTDTRDNNFVYQLRYVCTTRPYGPFVSDPAGSITEIKPIEPTEYRKFFDWGEIGERIVTRAMEIYKNHLK